jgi:hypothetical protein
VPVGPLCAKPGVHTASSNITMCKGLLIPLSLAPA